MIFCFCNILIDKNVIISNKIFSIRYYIKLMSCDKNKRLSCFFFCLYVYNVVVIIILLKNINIIEKRIKN